jgi:1-acyl-sn-glycerol-3-phosphate acyltransferase
VLTLLLGSALLLLGAWWLKPSNLSKDGTSDEIRGVFLILWWINRGYCSAIHRLVVLNEAPLPKTGPAILIANHTCGVDNFLLQAGCQRVLGFMVAEQFYHLWPLSILAKLLGCIPVKRDGRDLSATREGLRALSLGKILPIFPEGRITPKSGLEFGEGKPGAAFLTLRAHVPVIPAYIRGTPPTNNVYLAGITPSNARVIFGAPIDLSAFHIEPLDREHEKALLNELTHKLMDAVKALKDQSIELESTL